MTLDAQTITAVGGIVIAICTVANNFMTYRLSMRQTTMHHENQNAIAELHENMTEQHQEISKRLL